MITEQILHNPQPDYGGFIILTDKTINYFLFSARSIATAIATEAPTIGLLPMPRKPIIST